MNEGRPTGRLAPSPTGHLHLGHARSFLLAWWHARAGGGRVLLRLEDLDAERVKPGMADEVLRDLEWLGLDWDGPLLRQSDDLAPYAEASARLLARGLAYPCTCTRREVELAASAPHASDGATAYPGTCRGRFATREEARAATGRDAALRLRVEGPALELEDGFAGPFRVDVAAEGGDFPIVRRDGVPAYQLAVVVDDARQGVTEVLRGDDLLASAARQRLLQRALGLPTPRWFHVPLVVDAAGERLAKRRDDLSLAALRTEGVDPRAVVGWAARSAGQGDAARLAPGELVGEFRLERVPRAPALLDGASLEALRSARA